jgi:hypothetical protein
MSFDMEKSANDAPAPTTLGQLSQLPPEIRALIWSYVLADMTITHSIRDRAFNYQSAAILNCSTLLREEIAGAAKLNGVYTFPTAWDLENYLAHTNDVTRIPHHIRLGIRAPRISLYSSPANDPLIRQAIVDALAAWLRPIMALPRDGFRQRTILLDLGEAKHFDHEYVFYVEFAKFARRVAIREHMTTKGRRSVRLDGPRELVSDLCRGQGIGEFVAP